MARAAVTADDFGLTRENTRTIGEAVDTGNVTRVSVIPNGYAVSEALAFWKERKDTLQLSVHLNLSEGKALGDPSIIPHLTHADGTFRYSPIQLLMVALLGGKELRREVRHELELQVARVRGEAGDAPLFVDGHQHIQMIPMVGEVLRQLHAKQPFASMRVTREPFFLPGDSPLFYFGVGGLRHFGLNLLAGQARKRSKEAGIATDDYFVGSLMSGRHTLRGIEAALLEARRHSGGSVEVGIHPGSAKSEELDSWCGDRAWHTSAWRTRERALLVSREFSSLIKMYEDETLPQTGTRSLEIIRFGISGAIATGTNLGILYALTDLAGIFYLASAIFSYAIATVVSFLLQKFWTFTHHSTVQARREFALYVMNNVLGIIFNLAGLHVLVEYVGIWYVAAQFILLALIATWNFFVFKAIIFRTKRPA